MNCVVSHQLLNSSQFLREPQKPVLANAIWSLLPHGIPGKTSEVLYVLDGGTLYHGQKKLHSRKLALSILNMSQGNMVMQL